MTRPVKDIAIYLVILIFISLFAPIGNYSSAIAQPLKARLINLKVSGSEGVKNMMENFLTQHDFIPVDDGHVPLLKVDAEGIRSGGLRECTVTYHINKLELRLPQGGKIYSFSGKSAHGYGTEHDASHSALHELKEYLNQDKKLMAKLNEVTYYNYYNLELPNEPMERELDEIKEKILELIITLERNDEVRKQLQEFGKKQTLLSKQIAKLAHVIRNGRGQISEQAVVQLLNTQEQLVRTQKTQYSISANCPQAESRDYATIGAVLIRVPVPGTQILRSGTYGVYAENHCIVYERTTVHAGPRFFSSIQLLQNSSMGRYFRSNDNYLEIKAVAYHPEDHSIIISGCDADSIMHANIKGMHPGKIFAEGRVLLIPDPGLTLER